MSVVIANHNHAAFVLEAVASALSQTYRRIEVVVVDDASTDDSVARLTRTYGDQIRIVALTENRGQVRAIEAGLGHASGEIVCLLDADDRWLPHKVARVVEAFATDPQLVQISHGLHTIDRDGRPLTGRRRLLRHRWARRLALSSGDARTALFRWNRYGCGITSGLSYPRWVLEQATPMPEEFLAECTYFDTWSTVAAAFTGPVGSIPENLMEYRIHGANAAGGSTEFGRFIRCWRSTGRMVDLWAERTGDPRRSDVDKSDNRLVLFRFLDGEAVPARARLRAVARTPIELWDLESQVLDGVIRFAERLVMASSRRRGAEVKEVGLNRWLRRRA